MLGWLAKGGLLAAGVSGVAMAATMGQAHLAWVGTQVQQAWPPRLPSSGIVQPLPSSTQAVQPVITDPFSYTIDQWRRLQQSDNLPFSSYADFLLAHPGWPGETSRRAAAETVADASVSPAQALRFFDRFPPITAAGRVRYAEALAASGQGERTAEQARRAWRMGVLRASDESKILALFPGALSPADYDARIDMLLWQGATTSAQRWLAFASPAARAIFDARIAYRTKAPDAAIRGSAVEAAGQNDAGFLADRANWYRDSGGSPTARAQLARPHAITTPPGSAEKWFEVLLTNARGASADGQHATAYDIARQVDDAYLPGTDVASRPLGERDDYTSLVWLAGTTAMKQLGRPRDAVGMFDRYSRGSKTPTTQSKGLYWAGRAAEAAGDQASAQAYYARAAGFGDLYYGQLASERLGQALRRPTPVNTATIDPAARAAFANREVVRAARLLGQQGNAREQGMFIRQIATDATTDIDHALATELAAQINRPDLGVLVGKSALQNGLSDYTAAGYPSVRVPAAANDSWTMVHAIARQESQFDRNAVSHAGARGLMQLMPGTARDVAGKLGLGYDPSQLNVNTDYNIQLGSHYFEKMYALYGSYPLAVAAYNAGPGNVNKWLRANGDPRTGQVDVIEWVEAIPFFETKNYVQRVLENAVVYDLMNPDRARSRGPANLSWYLGKRTPG
ncbi:transglycosylase SLT domain-containing protein [Sphingomonas floccifaciens]|uniref:Transglycosylase SLT domain-containing protein n=1 Tax=Sphingomonas floccifaciens TaxID=1844115 RepID=A0ABW4NAS2_9SPHN